MLLQKYYVIHNAILKNLFNMANIYYKKLIIHDFIICLFRNFHTRYHDLR